MMHEMWLFWTQVFVNGKIECAKAYHTFYFVKSMWKYLLKSVELECNCFMFSELQEWSPYDWFAKWQYIADGA